VNGLGDSSTDKVNVLADLQHDDGDTAVLADGYAFPGSDFIVLDELHERLAPKR
jgi:hypothetical protein